jgi:uncharacterized protein
VATGDFIWYELITRDPAAAERFYGAVVGWTFGSFEGAPGYRIVQAGGPNVGGILPMPAEAAASGMRPGWFGYVAVPDVDAAVEEVLAAGGRAHMPATTIDGVGRIAMLADPQGASFYVMTPASDGESTAFAPEQVRHFAWNELATRDLDAALGFYERQFGWTPGHRMAMGDAGDYVMIDHRGQAIGGAMARAAGGPPPTWLFYTHVPDIEATPDRIRVAGGTVLHGPAPVPGGSKVVVALDPEGAGFGLVGPAA